MSIYDLLGCERIGGETHDFVNVFLVVLDFISD
jgi:hypothetical protein